MKKTKEEILGNLPYYNGSEEFCKFSPLSKLIASEGAMYVANSCGAFWLLDIVASCQLIAAVRREVMQAYTLTVQDNEGLVVVTDGNKKEIYRQEIPYTDFPLDEIILWVRDGVVFLPSEY